MLARRPHLLVFLATVALAVPARAYVCDGVVAACSLEDLGNDRYRFAFDVTNGSPEANVIFKWAIVTPVVPREWVTVSFDLPPGWSGNHPDNRLDFQIPNGSYNTDRIYSPSAAYCGGETSLTFIWTFDWMGGREPDCDFELLDFTFHMQGVDTNCANYMDSFVCPGPVPVDPATWGRIKDTYVE